jgi:ABC-type transporter Mla MlaB component
MANLHSVLPPAIALVQTGSDACRVEGVLNLFTIPELLSQWQNLISSLEQPMLSIDLAGLTKFDSAAVAFCVTAVREGQSVRCTIKFTNPPLALVAIAKIVRLESLFY